MAVAECKAIKKSEQTKWAMDPLSILFKLLCSYVFNLSIPSTHYDRNTLPPLLSNNRAKSAAREASARCSSSSASTSESLRASGVACRKRQPRSTSLAVTGCPPPSRTRAARAVMPEEEEEGVRAEEEEGKGAGGCGGGGAACVGGGGAAAAAAMVRCRRISWMLTSRGGGPAVAGAVAWSTVSRIMVVESRAATSSPNGPRSGGCCCCCCCCCAAEAERERDGEEEERAGLRGEDDASGGCGVSGTKRRWQAARERSRSSGVMFSWAASACCVCVL